jgi:hypothetical protein
MSDDKKQPTGGGDGKSKEPQRVPTQDDWRGKREVPTHNTGPRTPEKK